MSVDTLLSCLEKVRQTGPGKWQALCPAHDDRTPSLAIREEDDGRVLVHCVAGCSALDAISAVGLDWSDLYPDKPLPVQGHKPIRRPFLPTDAFDTLRHINQIMLIIVGDMVRGKGCPVESHMSLMNCQKQLDDIAELCYGKN